MDGEAGAADHQLPGTSRLDLRTEKDLQRRLHAGEPLLGRCPVCMKPFRPTSYSTTVVRSIKAHIRSKAPNCPAHLRFHRAIQPPHHACPAAPCQDRHLRHSSEPDAWAHFVVADDPPHRHCKLSYLQLIEAARTRREQREQDLINRHRESLLYASAKDNDLPALTQLIRDGVDVNAGGEDGFTPLMTAAEAGHVAVVNLLLQYKQCAVNRQNKYGQTALSMAAQNNRIHVVRSLLTLPRLELNLVGNAGLNAAQVARLAGHDQVADAIASKDYRSQMKHLLNAISSMTKSHTHFDSLQDRLVHLFHKTGTALPAHDLDNAHEYNLDDEEDDNGTNTCVVCLSSPIQMAAVPCWHALYCADCIQPLRECAICRVKIQSTQRIFLP